MKKDNKLKAKMMKKPEKSMMPPGYKPKGLKAKMTMKGY